MTTTPTRLNLDLRLPFEAAGVEFRISVSEPSAPGEGSAFSLIAVDAETSERLKFDSATSVVLADWVRGYTRWLYRAGVTASYTEDAISGVFAERLNAEQTLEGVRLACDMIRQRFELYEESALT